MDTFVHLESSSDMKTVYDWVNTEDFKDLRVLIKLEDYMEKVLCLNPDTDTPTYHPHTHQVIFDNGYSFVIPPKVRTEND